MRARLEIVRDIARPPPGPKFSVQAFAKSYVGGDGNAEPGPVEQYKGILSVPTFSQKYSFCREDLTVRLHFQRIDVFMEESSNWVSPPYSLSLGTGQVHVWRICLEQGDD